MPRTGWQSTRFGAVHHCGPECDEDALADAATIEEFTCVGDSGSSLRAISRSMIDQYRRALRQ